MNSDRILNAPILTRAFAGAVNTIRPALSLIPAGKTMCVPPFFLLASAPTALLGAPNVGRPWSSAEMSLPATSLSGALLALAGGNWLQQIIASMWGMAAGR